MTWPFEPAVPPTPAEAATDIGVDDGLPEGGAVALLFVAIIIILAVLGVVHIVTRFL